VVDTKSIMQFVLNPTEQGVIEVAAWFYQVSGQCVIWQTFARYSATSSCGINREAI
jgi:hypothetical protein